LNWRAELVLGGMTHEERPPQIPDFPDGVAVVIGGSGGVGSVICEKLAQAGTDVVLTYHQNAQRAEAVADTIRRRGRRAGTFPLSVSDSAAVSASFGTVIQQYARIHTVVIAAGSSIPMRYISQLQDDDWKRVMDADVNGFFHVVRAALPHLREKGGSFVHISSAGVRRWPVRDGLSVIPKAAIDALMRGIAREEGRFGIRANSVALGVIEAGMFLRFKETQELDEQWMRTAIANTPLRRFGAAEEVAETVVFLASRKAAYITGQTIFLDGGYGI
jgi:NAD(P)-dependent dehydrogenase (short-subunit alcohol dehydrogenase family)